MIEHRHWGFVIDTNKYAGNFERELCAHITGKIGECGVGSDYVEDLIDIDFDNVEDMPDGNGCFRPCAVYPNPRYKNNGMGFGYKDGEEGLALQKLKASQTEYGQNLFDQYKNTDINYAKKELDRWVKKAEQTTEVPAYECFNSVIIFFSTKPTEKQIEFMKLRAKSFKDYCDNDGYIEGFRLIEFKSTNSAIDV